MSTSETPRTAKKQPRKKKALLQKKLEVIVEVDDFCSLCKSRVQSAQEFPWSAFNTPAQKVNFAAEKSEEFQQIS